MKRDRAEVSNRKAERMNAAAKTEGTALPHNELQRGCTPVFRKGLGPRADRAEPFIIPRGSLWSPVTFSFRTALSRVFDGERRRRT